MSTSANYPSGFAKGHTSMEIPLVDIQNSDGNVFWVDSTNGLASDSAGGRGTFKYPFATIDYAIGRCSANNGDKIIVAAGHAESVASATDLVADIAGISIIGMGIGENRPVITFTTVDTAVLDITGADVRISNILFKGNIANQAKMIDLSAKRIRIDNCKFMEGSATGLEFIDINGGVANACDGAVISNNEFYAPTAGNYNSAIELAEANDTITIENNTIWGDFDDGCIHNPTGATVTNLTIKNNILSNLQSGQHAIELVSACTGVAANNFMYTDTYATTFDPGALACFENYSVSSVDKNGRLNPVVET